MRFTGRIRLTIACVVFAATLFPAAIRAQVPGPLLDRGVFEVGYTYKWFHRDMEPHPPVDKDWEVGALYVRYGLVRLVTVSLEGGVWEVTHREFEGMDYLRYTLGGGITVGLFEVRGILLSGSYHYNEVMDRDRSRFQFHKSTRGELLTIQAETGLRIRRIDATAWGGPAYANDESLNYLWGWSDPLRDESSDNWGVIAGVDAVAFDRLTFSAHVLYADYWQPRMQFGVRL